MTASSSIDVEESDIMVLPAVDDYFDELLANAPTPKYFVDSTNVPSDVLCTREHISEVTGLSIEFLKEKAPVELLVPLNPRAPGEKCSSRPPSSEGSEDFGRSPLKFNELRFHGTPSLPNFGPRSSIAPIPMSPNVNLFPAQPQTHSTPSVHITTSTAMSMTITRGKDNVDVVKRNIAVHNQTMSLDSGMTATIVVEGNDLPVAESDSPPPLGENRGKKLNRTFTKEDLLLMRQSGALERTHTKLVAESEDEEDQESVVSNGNETCSIHSEPGSSNLNRPVITAPVVQHPPPQQPKQPASKMPVMKSQLPAPGFQSRLMQPKIYKNGALSGSATSLSSNSSNKGNVPEDAAAYLPGSLQRAGTFTKDKPASSNAPQPRKQSVPSVLPNKMSAPRASMAAPVGRKPTGASSTSIHAVRYGNNNNSRPSSASSRRTIAK